MAKTAVVQKSRYAIEHKAGYRIVDNLTGEWVSKPYQSLGDAIADCRIMNLKELKDA